MNRLSDVHNILIKSTKCMDEKNVAVKNSVALPQATFIHLFEHIDQN